MFSYLNYSLNYKLVSNIRCHPATVQMCKGRRTINLITQINAHNLTKSSRETMQSDYRVIIIVNLNIFSNPDANIISVRLDV
jgi:hypothetical protein